MLLEIWDNKAFRDKFGIWEQYYASCPTFSPYLDPHWLSLLTSSFHWQSCHIIARSNNEILGILPAFSCGRPWKRHIISLPLCHYTPIVAKHDNIKMAMLDKLVLFAQSQGYAGATLHSSMAVPRSEMSTWYSMPDKWASVLDLTTYGNSYVPHSASVGRNVRKALASGVTIRERTNPDACKTLFRLLVTTRKRQGVPPYPKSFISHLYHCPGVKIFEALLDNEVVASIALLTTSCRAIYLYGASYPSAFPVRANDLLFFNVINTLISKNYLEFDFGATPEWHTELLRYKNKWGCISTLTNQLVWFHNNKGHRQIDIRTTKTGKAIGFCIHYTPEPILNFCSSLFFRYLF